MRTIRVSIIALLVGFALPISAIEIRNFDDLAQKTGFLSYYNSTAKLGRPVKVAIFDNGFDGYDKLVGHSLPANTIYRPGTSNGTVVSSDHGLGMAQILTAFMTNNMKRPELAPQLYLYQVTGFTNLKAAIDDAISQHVDVIMHALLHEYGSNFDGRGFFNAEVNRAVNAGIIWINAAGDSGKTTYNQAIMSTTSDGWVTLPGPNQSIPIRCTPSHGQTTCPARFALVWNDFKDNPNLGTVKDLDFYITDDTLNIVGASSLTQTTDQEKANQPNSGYSLYPREIIETELQPGRYFLRVKNRSNNFVSGDRLRISTDSPSVSFEYIDRNESIVNPADNAGVITVGAKDTGRSSVSENLGKPEISTYSVIQTGVVSGQQEQFVAGSSNSAAIVAAGVALLIANGQTALAHDAVIKSLNAQFFARVIGHGLTTAQLTFGPANGNCFERVDLAQLAAEQGPLPYYIQRVLDFGGVLVKTTKGMRIVVNFDPANLAIGHPRVNADDMILTVPVNAGDGSIIPDWAVYPRSEIANIPASWAEVFELPTDAEICQ
jgi:hypothetical protein